MTESTYLIVIRFKLVFFLEHYSSQVVKMYERNKIFFTLTGRKKSKFPQTICSRLTVLYNDGLTKKQLALGYASKKKKG